MPRYPPYLDWLRYLCALLLYFYGVSKLTGHQLVVPSWVAQQPVGSLSGFTLTWFYFGYSHGYKSILGLLQVACATLLLFRRSTLLAAALIFPVMVNIVLINIFYRITNGAESMALFILASLSLILWQQRRAFVQVLWTGQPTEPATSRNRHRLVRSLILLFVLGQLIVGTVAFSKLSQLAQTFEHSR